MSIRQNPVACRQVIRLFRKTCLSLTTWRDVSKNSLISPEKISSYKARCVEIWKTQEFEKLGSRKNLYYMNMVFRTIRKRFVRESSSLSWIKEFESGLLPWRVTSIRCRFQKRQEALDWLAASFQGDEEGAVFWGKYKDSIIGLTLLLVVKNVVCKNLSHIYWSLIPKDYKIGIAFTVH